MTDSTQALCRLEDVPQSSVGAPMPLVLAGYHELSLIYYPELVELGQGNDSAAFAQEDRVAIVRFTRPYAHTFGPPNEEAISGHPLSKIGLEPFEAYEVVSSDWISDLCDRNRVHPHHRDEPFKKDHHYIFTFHDETFEAIAHGYTVEMVEAQSSLQVGQSELQRWENER